MKKGKGGRMGRWRKEERKEGGRKRGRKEGGREEGGREKYRIEPSDEGFNLL